MKESVYQQSFLLENVHLDRFGRPKLSALLSFVQDISERHAASLGVGWDVLTKKNLFWAIIRHRIQITRMPVAGETLHLQTWPMPTTHTAYPRATVAYDIHGQEVFRTVALWVLMDTKTRAMVLPRNSGVTIPGVLRVMDLKAPGSLVPVSLANKIIRQVDTPDLDRNGHMNNTRYLDWVSDLLPEDFPQFQIPAQVSLCYLAEAREGQQLALSWELDRDGTLRVEAIHAPHGGKSHRVFAAAVTFFQA